MWGPTNSNDFSSFPVQVLPPSLIPSILGVLGLVLSSKYLPASRAAAVFVEFTVWLIRKGTCATDCGVLRKKVVSSEALKRR